MVAQQFDQLTYVCEEYNNLQDSKLVFIISDFKIFQKMLQRQLNFGVVGLTAILRLLKKPPLFFNLQFLLLLSEKGLALKVAQQFIIQGLVTDKPAAYKKN